MSIFVATPFCFDYYSSVLTILTEIREYDTFSFVGIFLFSWMLFDIYCSNAYSDLSHWGRKTKAKICKCNWINLKIFLQQKQTKENHWRKKKITCWIEENICKQSNSKPLIFKIYKQATQYEKHKQHNFKNGQRIFHLSSWLLCR